MLVVAPVAFAVPAERDFWMGPPGLRALERWLSGLSGLGAWARVVLASPELQALHLAAKHGLDTLELPVHGEYGEDVPGWCAALAALRRNGAALGQGVALLDFRYPRLEPHHVEAARALLESGGNPLVATVRPCRDHPCQFESHEDEIDAGLLAFFDPERTHLHGSRPAYGLLPLPGCGPLPDMSGCDWLAGLTPPSRAARLVGVSASGASGRPATLLWEEPGQRPHERLLAQCPDLPPESGLRAAFLPVLADGQTADVLQPEAEQGAYAGWRLPCAEALPGLCGFAFALTRPACGPGHQLTRWLEPADGRWFFDHLRQVMVDGRSGQPITGRQSFPELHEFCGALRMARPEAVDLLGRADAWTGCSMLPLPGEAGLRVQCALDVES